MASTWSGWENQLLNAAGILVTPPNRQLLDLWTKNRHTSCDNNPIDLAHKLTGSANCGPLTGIFPQAQRYTSHAQAATAFRDEIHADFAKALLSSLNSGNPFQDPNFNNVASVFVSWGSPKMARAYLDTATGTIPGSGDGGGSATGVHKGWADLRKAVNVHAPADLHRSDRLTKAALRSLHRARKVRL